MNLPPLHEMYGQHPIASPINMHHAYSYPPPPIQGTVNPYFDDLRSAQNDYLPLSSFSSTLPTMDGAPTLHRRPQCPQCKGQKYNFTAYFHNKAIFSEPPHELIPWIQRSYYLKNSLQSLLVTYAVHEVDLAFIRDIEKGINNWHQQVEALIQEVCNWGSGSEEVVNGVNGVHQWTMNMVRQLRDHVGGIQQLPLPKGRVKKVVLEFRKCWERAWIAGAEYQRGLMMSHGCSVGYSY